MRVVYVTYDGALDPLGASQVLPYLLGLCRRGIEISLISFEKHERWIQEVARKALQQRLEAAGIRWSPLSYHRRPRLPATLWDIHRGSSAIAHTVRQRAADIVHCRSDVAMFMARRAGLPKRVRLLYDVRGLFADERAESGSWRRGSLIDRLVRGVETKNLAAADGLVVLTNAAREVLARRRGSLPEHRVIPTCADTAIFRPPGADVTPEYGLVYVGSLGTWYMTCEMVAFARIASDFVPGRTLFLTPNVQEARAAGATDDWAEVRTVAYEQVPPWLQLARASFFFYAATPARRGTSPTKLGEALATGLPVVANHGIGDLDGFLEAEGVGTFVESFTAEGYRAAARRLDELIRDPRTVLRCRRLAEQRFALDGGVAAYADLYGKIAG